MWILLWVCGEREWAGWGASEESFQREEAVCTKTVAVHTHVWFVFVSFSSFPPPHKLPEREHLLVWVRGCTRAPQLQERQASHQISCWQGWRGHSHTP